MKDLFMRIILSVVLIVFIIRCNDCHETKKQINIIDNYTLVMNDTFDLIAESQYQGAFFSYFKYFTKDSLFIVIAVGGISPNPQIDWDIASRLNLNETEDKIKKRVEMLPDHRQKFVYLMDYEPENNFKILSYIDYNSKSDKKLNVFYSTTEIEDITLHFKMYANEDKYTFETLENMNKYFLKNIKIRKQRK